MKIKISNRFWITPNSLLFNAKISFKAKGLYWYIQAKPDDWDFSAVRIALETKDGRDGISAGLQELEEFWYLRRHKFKNQKWQWEIEYELLESPDLTEKTTPENPGWTQETTPENPSTENPSTEKPSTNKTRSTKKEIQNNSDNISEFESFWLIYKRKIDKGRAEKSFNLLTAQEKILAAGGAKKWTEYWDADKTDLQYIPHPTTWLNNKRWQVEPPKATKKAPANAYQDQPEGFLEGFTR